MPFVQATVVRAQEPTSARPGDRAIVLADGSIEGFVGGQCAAGSVRTAALDALGTGESLLLRVLPDGDEAFPESPGASIVVNPCLSGGALEIYLEPLLPAAAPRRGRARRRSPRRWPTLAEPLGFVVDRDGDGPAKPAGATAVVVSSHGGDEAGAIRAALDAGVGFVGVVCSHTRGAALLAELDLTDAERARVHTHVGLDIGARTAAGDGAVDHGRGRPGIRVEGLPRAGPAPAPAAVQAVDPVCGMTVTIGPDTPHAPSTARPLVLHARLPRPLPGGRAPGDRHRPGAGGRLLGRLGQPKQLLAFRGATLLDATLDGRPRVRSTRCVVTVGRGGRRGAGAGRPPRRRGGRQPRPSATAAPPRSGPRSPVSTRRPTASCSCSATSRG